MVRSKLLSRVLGKEFMELVEDLGAKVDKCSYINENINFFLQYRSRSSFDL